MCNGAKINPSSKHQIEGEGENAVPFEEALESTGCGICQIKVTITGGLIIMCSYINISAISFILPAAQCDLAMNSVRKGTLISAGFIGIILTCHMWGFLSDTLGRRYILIRCIFADGIFYFITSFMPYYELYLVLRFIHGFAACGAVIPVYAYIGEMHSDKFRTRSLMAAAVLANCGFLYSAGLGWVTIPGTWELPIFSWLVYKPWRLFYALLGVPSLIASAALLSLPESPKYLLAADKKEEALIVLKTIHKQNKCKMPFTINSITSNTKEDIAKLDRSSNKIVAVLNLMWNQTAPLLKPPHRSNIALICLMQYLLYFCDNGMFLWLPETINRLAKFEGANTGQAASFCEMVKNHGASDLKITGIAITYPVTITHHNISQKANIVKCTSTVEVTVFQSMVLTSIGLMLGLLFVWVLRRFLSQKIVLGGTVFVSLVSIILMLITEGTYLLIMELSVMIILIAAAIPIVTNSVVDLFPTNIRAMAVCLTLLSARCGTVTANQVAGALIDEHCVVLLGFVIFALSVCVIINMVLPTKTKYLEEGIKINKDEVNE